MDDNIFKINLEIDGKEKQFLSEPSGEIVFDAAELSEKIETAPLGKDIILEIADFVVKLFNNQFTREELISGSKGVANLGKNLLSFAMISDSNSVMSRFLRKGQELPKNQ